MTRQCSCLENPMDGGAWKAEVHGVAEGWTRLSDFTFTFYFHALEKEMATHSSVLAWRIPESGELGGLPSVGSHSWVFQICWHIECNTFTASSFSIWNSSTGIPSPPLALFLVEAADRKQYLMDHPVGFLFRWWEKYQRPRTYNTDENVIIYELGIILKVQLHW